ncbi:MlaD family protein [Mycobacterium sp. CVI_P3]|uniref:MlaD family protein n=1 Tax=Mycobacterium pinniadriaticum TaxID=2994102 RepID=A0ABT3SC65_9MYCO|nr:MlaD family protein [Mycobacterium pinniadriaticum]MCX2930689.1 MlaD family protein [Mycobacterium pinniadriaticum]MCX2937113.1 MlaD family protein [Mycobacterium pinniadriaticum]
MNPISALWRLVIAGVVATLLIVLVINVISQPVGGKLTGYTADFTDVSGLRSGADVRVRGVRVGKVESIELKRHAGRSVAEVALTLDSAYKIGAETRLAVKYQALTGLRYIDVQNPAEGSTPSALTANRIPTSMTQPSFDITRLFNGLQPVLATLSPEDLNVFTANADNFLSGDGTGIGPVLESLNTLTRFLADRQQVVSTLLHNLKSVATEMSGHSRDFIHVVELLNEPIDAALSVLDEFRKSQIYGPDFTRSVSQLLDNAGLKPGIDVDRAIDKAITNFDDVMDAVKMVPVVWDNIPSPAEEGAPIACSQGRAELPLPVDVLLNGQKVVLCKQ